MADENKTVELTEEDLQKVSGGVYVEGLPKYKEGYCFKHSSYAAALSGEYDYFKISKVIGFQNVAIGYRYSIDLYYNNILDYADYTKMTDDEIDTYGTPFTK